MQMRTRGLGILGYCEGIWGTGEGFHQWADLILFLL